MHAPLSKIIPGKRCCRGGFTILESLIVLGILAIMAIVIVNLTRWHLANGTRPNLFEARPPSVGTGVPYQPANGNAHPESQALPAIPAEPSQGDAGVTEETDSSITPPPEQSRPAPGAARPQATTPEGESPTQ